MIAVVGLVLCLVGAFVNPHQFSYLLAVCVRVFLHALRRLFLLDHRPSRHRRRMVGGRAAAVGKHRAACCRVLAFFFIPILLLRHHLYRWMDIPPGHRRRARRQARVSELVTSSSSAPFSFSSSSDCRDSVAAALFRRARISDGNPRFTIWMRKVAFISLPLFALCSHLWRLRLADGPELPLVLHHVGRVHFCRRRRQFDVAARAGDHRFAQGRLSEGHRHARALPHHGEMDARLHAFSGPTSASANTCSSGMRTSRKRRNTSSSEIRNRGGRSACFW